jgi:hypothetical protein
MRQRYIHEIFEHGCRLEVSPGPSDRHHFLLVVLDVLSHLRFLFVVAMRRVVTVITRRGDGSRARAGRRERWVLVGATHAGHTAA